MIRALVGFSNSVFAALALRVPFNSVQSIWPCAFEFSAIEFALRLWELGVTSVRILWAERLVSPPCPCFCARPRGAAGSTGLLAFGVAYPLAPLCTRGVD